MLKITGVSTIGPWPPSADKIFTFDMLNFEKLGNAPPPQRPSRYAPVKNIFSHHRGVTVGGQRMLNPGAYPLDILAPCIAPLWRLGFLHILWTCWEYYCFAAPLQNFLAPDWPPSGKTLATPLVKPKSPTASLTIRTIFSHDHRRPHKLSWGGGSMAW